MTRIGGIVPTHGYSSFKFIPSTNDTIITAIKTLEIGEGVTATYIIVFTVKGEIIFPETIVIDQKFEGFQFKQIKISSNLYIYLFVNVLSN